MGGVGRRANERGVSSRRRPLHLIIVSYGSVLDRTLETIAQLLSRGATENRVVERAQRHSDLRYLTRLWHLRDFSLHTVDVIGHGSSGRIMLGDEILFDSSGTGFEYAKEIAPFLAPRAALRLLGCGVGRDTTDRTFHGTRLLRALARILGAQRQVLAPTRSFSTADYRADGLRPAARRALTAARSPTQGSPTHGSEEEGSERQRRQAQLHHQARG